MNPLLQQLHDIDGLDPISWWPLAIGWWVVIAIACVILCIVTWYGLRWLAYKRSWKSDALQKLLKMEKQLSDSTTRESAIVLSEYLRRIALRRYSRKECAGLFGDEWLKWLSKNDPKGFDWEQRGILLVNAPYTPVDMSLSANQMKELIQAVREWVR